MAEVDPSNYAELMEAQAALDACLTEIGSLEDEWLELSDLLGLG